MTAGACDAKVTTEGKRCHTVKSFWWHCFCPLRSVLGRSILHYISFLILRFSNKIQVTTALKRLCCTCVLFQRAHDLWKPLPLCSKYDRFILTWNQVNNIASPKKWTLLRKHPKLRRTYVLSGTSSININLFHFRCVYKVQQILNVVGTGQLDARTKQHGTPCDLLVNSEIRISTAFEIY